MEPKLILPTLVALVLGFFYLAGNQKVTVPEAVLLGGTFDGDGMPLGKVTAETKVVQPDGPDLTLGALVDGVDMALIDAAPAEIRLLAPVADCALSPPAAGQRVVAVMAPPSGVASRIYSYDASEIPRAAAAEVTRVMGAGHDGLAKLKRLRLEPEADLALDVVNVVIPPGEEPVYLVLKDSFGGILWNILPMPGARVAQVTLLAPRNAGVVNLPDGASLQAATLDQGDCGAFRRVIESPAVTEAAGFVPSDQTRAEWAAYSAWFSGTFGIPADAGLSGRKTAPSVLAGAAPTESSARAVWAGVAGKVAYLLPAEVLYAADPAQHRDWFTAKAEAEIAQAFGAPEGSDIVALLRPATHVRSD